MTPRKSSFSEEFAIIPQVMFIFVVLGYACSAFLFLNYMPLHDPHAPPEPVRLLLAVLAGSVLAVYFLLIGYVNQDSKRRGMGQLLWTLLVILVPNCLGFLAYFLLRKPLLQACPRCGERVEKEFHFCAKCGYSLTPSCSQCGQSVSPDFVCCPYCGKPLGTTPSA
jgi:hypothetical protein